MEATIHSLLFWHQQDFKWHVELFVVWDVAVPGWKRHRLCCNWTGAQIWCQMCVTYLCEFRVSEKMKMGPVIQVVLVGVWETCSVRSHIHWSGRKRYHEQTECAVCFSFVHPTKVPAHKILPCFMFCFMGSMSHICLQLAQFLCVLTTGMEPVVWKVLMCL
jgi:hypothetical protein